MLHWRYSGLLILTAGVMALAGCSSYSVPSTKRAAWEPPLLPPRTNFVREVDQNLVDAHAHYAQAVLYDLDQKFDLAREELAKAFQSDHGNADLALDLSRRYLADKQPDKALEVLNRAAAVPEISGSVFARLSLVYAGMDKDEQAIQAGQAAIKRSPDLMDGYRVLFFRHMQKDRPQEALKILDQAAKVTDTSVEFRVELVDLYLGLARQVPLDRAIANSNALKVLNRTMMGRPSDPRLRLRLAEDYSQLGDMTNSAKMYESLLDSYPDLPGTRAAIHDKLARIYLRNKDYPRASEQLEAIIQNDPANAEAYYLLGSLAEEQKKFLEAADYFRKTLLLRDDIEEAYYDLAETQLNLNKSKEAMATLDKAHEKFPRGFVAELLTAIAYEKQKDYTNALNHFTAAEVIAKATEPNRLTGSFYFDQGAAFERAGHYDQAEHYFEKSLELTPDSAEAMNYLGYMLAEHGMKLEKARGLIEKALRLEPKSPAYLDSMGWVLYKLNRPEEALPKLQKAIELSEEPDPTLFDHLGDIYVALKKPDKAREAWTKSLAIEPNDEIQKKLAAPAGKPAS